MFERIIPRAHIKPPVLLRIPNVLLMLSTLIFDLLFIKRFNGDSSRFNAVLFIVKMRDISFLIFSNHPIFNEAFVSLLGYPH
jgi:hypothetical protein